MKILHVIPYFGPSKGGESAVCRALAITQEKAGNEVTILTTDVCDFDPIPKINIYSIPNEFSFGPIIYSPKMKKWFFSNAQNYDIIHLHTFRSYQNIIVCKFNYTKIPIIMQAHGSIPTDIGSVYLKKIYDYIYLKKMLTSLDGCIAISEKEICDYLNVGINEAKILKISNGISVEDYTNLPNSGIFREKFNIDRNIKLILFLGRLHEIKGPDILLNACKMILDNKIPIHLAFIGPDCGMESQLRSTIKKMEIEKSVSIIGPLYNMEKISAYVDSDLLVIPSRYETFPMVLLEAIMSNCAVILTNKCSIAAEFEDLVTIVQPNAEMLSKAIIEHLYSEKDRNEKIKKARERIIKDYGIEGVVEVLGEFYSSIVSNRKNNP